jgi:hypothetical protein
MVPAFRQVDDPRLVVGAGDRSSWKRVAGGMFQAVDADSCPD